MKIGILTLPLWYNYGGIIQAYALQEVIKEMNHEVVLIDYHQKKTKIGEVKKALFRYIKHEILRVKQAQYYPTLKKNKFK